MHSVSYMRSNEILVIEKVIVFRSSVPSITDKHYIIKEILYVWSFELLIYVWIYSSKIKLQYNAGISYAETTSF